MAATKQHRSPKVPEIRKGDTIVVLAGKDAGKRGTVDRVIRREPSPGGTRSIFRRGSSAGGVSVVVEGINISKRHTKPRQGSTSGIGGVPRIEPGGILDVNHPLPISKVMIVCSNCGKPTRIGHRTLDNGRRVRVCKQCGEQMEAKS
ncbi:MAG TPA: 50S ribosomal protein L24 [Patescibacteria group bacterium]|jgi:large subunit ribosomal protein L24|nr:50S ribosomal protein L24 [Patescibacteria group bacterium]